MTKKKRITVESAKQKGREFQYWVSQKISELLGLPWGRDELIAPREGGHIGTDIRLIGEAKKRFPYSVEAKWQETWDVPGWIRQAKKNQQEGTDWLLIIKKNRMDPVIVMAAERFFDLQRRALENDNQGDN